MFCKKCGRSLKDNTKFCPYCGEKIESGIPVTGTGTGVGVGRQGVKGSGGQPTVPNHIGTGYASGAMSGYQSVNTPDNRGNAMRDIPASEGYSRSSQNTGHSSQDTNTGGYSSNTGSQKPNPAPSSKPPKFPRGIVIAIASCASVAVIVAGVFMYFGSRDNKDDSKSTQGYEETVRGTEAVVKDTADALSESSTEAPASAETPDIPAILAAYQQYADGFAEEDLRYSLIYINDDDVPECLMWFGSFEVKVLSYIDNTIKVFEPEYYGSHMIEYAYTPRSGEFAVNQSYGVGGNDYILVKLSNVFEVKMHAESNGGFDTPGHWSAGYDINGESVDEETYLTQTDMSRFQQTIDTLSMDGIYDTILSAYAALDSQKKDPVKKADIDTVLAAYQQYIDGISELEVYGFDMAYINDDDMPECIVWIQGGVRVLSYVNNIIEIFSPNSAGGGTAEVAYTPGTGQFAVGIRYGHAGHDYSLVELGDGFKVKMHAESNGGFDPPGHWVADYEIDGEFVDEETYFAQTDMSHFQQTLNTYNSDSILSAYNALTSPEQPVTQEVSEFILPESNLRYMTYNDLKGIDATSLRIAKNEIYARHGRMFQSEDLSQYFNSKSWYSGTVSPDSFSDRVFNDFESGNISMIQYFQDGTPNGNYYAFALQYKYFNIDSGVLTVFANPTSWGGGHEGYALSLPISDNCVWWREFEQKPLAGGKDAILHIISDERAEYQKSPSLFEDPIGISVEVEGGVVVAIKVYVS